MHSKIFLRKCMLFRTVQISQTQSLFFLREFIFFIFKNKTKIKKEKRKQNHQGMYVVLHSLRFFQTKHLKSVQILMSYCDASCDFFVPLFDRETIDFDLGLHLTWLHWPWPMTTTTNSGSYLMPINALTNVATTTTATATIYLTIAMVCMHFYWYNHWLFHMWTI